MQETIEKPAILPEIPVHTTKTGMDPSKKAELVEKMRHSELGYNPWKFIKDYKGEGCALCIVTDNWMGAPAAFYCSEPETLCHRPIPSNPYIAAARILNITPEQAHVIESCTRHPKYSFRMFETSRNEVADRMEERL